MLRFPSSSPVRPEVNIIDVIGTNGGIRGAAQFEKTSACSTYPLKREDIGKELGNLISSAVWVNGKKVAESHGLRLPDHGRIGLQMHSDGRVEYLDPKIRLLRSPLKK